MRLKDFAACFELLRRTFSDLLYDCTCTIDNLEVINLPTWFGKPRLLRFFCKSFMHVFFCTESWKGITSLYWFLGMNLNLDIICLDNIEVKRAIFLFRYLFIYARFFHRFKHLSRDNPLKSFIWRLANFSK